MSDWEDRVQDFWAGADDSRPEEALERMRELASERGMESPEACYEWASVHDFLGLEDEAIRWYEQALDQGLEGDRRPQALVQLASSLRNVGRSGDAIALLGSMTPEPVTGAAPQAFLALALRDAGRADEALRVALLALAPTLPRYARSVTNYAEGLLTPREPR